MSVAGCLTASLALSIWVGALLVGQRLDRTLVELDALALVTAERAAECARLQAKVDLGPARRAELDARCAALALWLRILPAPGEGTAERLLERFQACCEISGGFGPTGTGLKTQPPPPVWFGDFREVDITMSCEGTLSQFIRFLRELERPEWFVRVNSFRCSINEQSSSDRRIDPSIRVGINVSTFRFDAR